MKKTFIALAAGFVLFTTSCSELELSVQETST